MNDHNKQAIADLDISDEGKLIVGAVLALNAHNNSNHRELLEKLIRTVTVANVQNAAMVSAITQMTGIDQATFVDTARRAVASSQIPGIDPEEAHEITQLADRAIGELFS